VEADRHVLRLYPGFLLAGAVLERRTAAQVIGLFRHMAMAAWWCMLRDR
jgi:hypothetical protein